ncbi:hypothetical protein Tco_0811576 [Tanacetum coccineum]|uniref:Histone deacetylase 6 n=1 Tax=Tanacetum coccineum TaxID=301880 RepID=A0ABQ4WGS8_9ASTR
MVESSSVATSGASLPTAPDGKKRQNCPVFDGIFEFCQASAGGSIGAAVKLNRQDADIAINWADGLHSIANKKRSLGFCYSIIMSWDS